MCERCPRNAMAWARPQPRPSLRVCLTCLARSLSLLDKAERPCEETEVNDAVARCWDPENVFGELNTDILEDQHAKMGIHGLVFSVEQHPSSALLVSGAWRGVPQWHANGHQRDVRMHAMLSDRSYPSAWRAATGPSGGAGAGRGGSTWPLRHSLKITIIIIRDPM